MSLRDRKRIEKGLFLIGQMVYAERSAGGKVHRRKAPMQGAAALNAKGKPTPELRTWVKLFVDQVQNEKWLELEDSRLRSSSPTVGELCAAYLEIAAAEYAKESEPKPSTSTQNAATLRRIAEAMGVGDNGRVDGLTADRVEKWLAGFCGGYAAEDGDRARTSAWGQLSQARSVWTAWTRPYYVRRGIKLPSCLDKWPRRKRDYSPSYRRPPEALRQATLKWYRDLEGCAPGAWTAATLMIQFAMRPIDAAALTWDAFVMDKGSVTLRYAPGKTDVRTAGSRCVTWPVDPALYQRLRAAGGKTHVVPGESPTARYDTFNRTLNPMMRGIGWDLKTYGKACYELRKLCVDAVYRAHGLERAVQISGDNAATVSKFYSDPALTGQAPVDVTSIV